MSNLHLKEPPGGPVRAPGPGPKAHAEGPLMAVTGSEDVIFDVAAAETLESQCRSAACQVESLHSSRTGWVATAKTDFSGYFSTVFSDNADIDKIGDQKQGDYVLGKIVESCRQNLDYVLSLPIKKQSYVSPELILRQNLGTLQRCVYIANDNKSPKTESIAEIFQRYYTILASSMQ